MRAFYLGLMFTASMTAAACTRLDSAPIQPAPLAEKDCTQAAMAAVKDAASDEYDAHMQDVVYKNSYAACEAAKQNAASAK
jgi:hypothetical protein